MGSFWDHQPIKLRHGLMITQRRCSLGRPSVSQHFTHGKYWCVPGHDQHDQPSWPFCGNICYSVTLVFLDPLHMQVPPQGSVISTGSSSSTMFNNVATPQTGGLWLRRLPVGHRVPMAHFCMSQLQSSASMELLFIIYPGSYWSQLTALIPGSPMIPAWLSCRNQLTQMCSA